MYSAPCSSKKKIESNPDNTSGSDTLEHRGLDQIQRLAVMDGIHISLDHMDLKCRSEATGRALKRRTTPGLGSHH